MTRGSCLCGGVTFRLGGELTPIQLCHATRCRKASGAAMAPEMLGRTDDFVFESGADLVQVYEAPLLEEPPAYRRAFCRVCGSPLPNPIEGTPFVLVNRVCSTTTPGRAPSGTPSSTSAQPGTRSPMRCRSGRTVHPGRMKPNSRARQAAGISVAEGTTALSGQKGERQRFDRRDGDPRYLLTKPGTRGAAHSRSHRVGGERAAHGESRPGA